MLFLMACPVGDWEAGAGGCLEEVWIGLGLRSGKDLGIRGTRRIKKRLGGEDEEKGGVKEASLWGAAMMGKRRGEEGEGMEASPSCLCCFQLSGRHCSSQDECGFEETGVERALWESHIELRCVSLSWSWARP